MIANHYFGFIAVKIDPINDTNDFSFNCNAGSIGIDCRDGNRVFSIFCRSAVIGSTIPDEGIIASRGGACM
jgi:hypothetical protein